MSNTSRVFTSQARQSGKSWLQSQNMPKVKPGPPHMIVGVNRANPLHPLEDYREFKPIGFLYGIRTYQVHNKFMTALGQYAFAVPTLDDLWCCTLERAIYAVRPWPAEFEAPKIDGHAILWRRAHRLCDIEQGIAALLMLHDRVAIIRSFDQGDKL